MSLVSVRRDSIAAASGLPLALTLALLLALTACAPVASRDGAATPEVRGSAVAVAAPAAAGDAAASDAPRRSPLIAPQRLPGWNEDDLSGLEGALQEQCRLARPPAPWPGLCAEVRARRTTLKAWIEERFRARPLASAGGDADGLITGYHESELRGSRVRGGGYQHPLHRRPDTRNPAGRAPREAIARGLAGSELVWLDDPVEAFFLHVQGSGRIRLTDGSVMRVGYGGDNGRPYVAIGSVLVRRGAMTAGEVDAGRIKAWLRANPEQAADVMNANPRYIFFRELSGLSDGSGPPGSLGAPLTPLRSIAVDPRQVSPGTLMWMDTTHPVDGRPMRRLVLAQDTGAAIVGEVRADLFWGAGADAETGAGLMKQRGRLWSLEPVRGPAVAPRREP